MPSSTVALRAYDFAQTLGVVTHIPWKNAGSSYADPAITLRSLAYLGVTHVREGVPYEGWTLPEYIAIAQTGIKFDLLVSSPTLDMARDLERIGRLEAAVPGSVASIEGVNEFNTNDVWLDGQNSRNNPAWVQLYGPKLWSAIKATPGLANVEVIAPSLASAGAAEVARQGSVASFSDSANWHTYFGQGDQPAQQMATNLALAKTTSPGEKVTITETGYYTAIDDMSWGGGGVSQAVQAILTVNIFLDAFKTGISTTYIYELLDNISNPATNDLENNFGLFLGDGTPKTSATAIHNLTTILSDKGSKAASFTPGALGSTVTGLSTTGSTFTLGKSDGSYDIVVWDEPDVWNQPTKSAINPPGQPVSVALGATYATVKVYDPLSGTAPIRVLTNVDRVELSLGSHPYIIEVPGMPVGSPPIIITPPAGGPVTIGFGANTLAVQISDDAWQGHAQFTIAIDGKQIGGTQTAAASHSAGQKQAFNVKGDFGPGSHTATINFLNDAWGGTVATDRNLFVDGAALDGATVAGAARSLMSGGPQSFGFTGVALPKANLLELQISEDAWQGDAKFLVKIDGVALDGVRTATASHVAGASQKFSFSGRWGAGPHTVEVQFINDAWSGGTGDRNLYVDRVTYDGRSVAGGTAALMSNGTASFAVPQAPAGTAAAAPVVPAPVSLPVVPPAPKTTALTLRLAEDAWQGDARFAIAVDGKVLGSGGTVTASNALGQVQAITLQAELTAGVHDVAISFLNDAYGGAADADRNLYVKGVAVNGTAVPGSTATLMGEGAVHVQITVVTF